MIASFNDPTETLLRKTMDCARTTPVHALSTLLGQPSADGPA
jgi:hypothetical protein